jgi:hypothetical protein
MVVRASPALSAMSRSPKLLARVVNRPLRDLTVNVNIAASDSVPIEAAITARQTLAARVDAAHEFPAARFPSGSTSPNSGHALSPPAQHKPKDCMAWAQPSPRSQWMPCAQPMLRDRLTTSSPPSARSATRRPRASIIQRHPRRVARAQIWGRYAGGRARCASGGIKSGDSAGILVALRASKSQRLPRPATSETIVA